MDIKEIRDCPDCGSANVIHGKLREQVICRDCGLIFEPAIPVEHLKPANAPKSAAAKPSGKKAKAVKKKAVKKKAVQKKAKKPAKKQGALKRFFKGLKKKR